MEQQSLTAFSDTPSSAQDFPPKPLLNVSLLGSYFSFPSKWYFCATITYDFLSVCCIWLHDAFICLSCMLICMNEVGNTLCSADQHLLFFFNATDSNDMIFSPAIIRSLLLALLKTKVIHLFAKSIFMWTLTSCPYL